MKKKDKLLQQPETFGHCFSTSVLVIVENENFFCFYGRNHGISREIIIFATGEKEAMTFHGKILI